MFRDNTEALNCRVLYMKYMTELLTTNNLEYDEHRVSSWSTHMIISPEFEWNKIERDGEIIGFVIINNSPDFNDNIDVYIEDVYIEPEYRRRGIVTGVVKQVLEKYKGKYIGLSVINTNQVARLFWLSIFSSLNILPETAINEHLTDMYFKMGE